MSLLELKKEYKGRQQNTSVNKKELCQLVKCGTTENRNVQLTKLAGFLNSNNIKGDMLFYIIDSVNIARGINLPKEEVKTIAQSISKYKSPNELSIDELKKDFKSYEQCVIEFSDNVRRYGTLKTGWNRADQVLKFLFPKEILFIAARSGVGKTTIGLTLGNNITIHTPDSSTLFVSLEMGASSIGFRLTNISLSRLVDSPCSAADTLKLFTIDVKTLKKIIDQQSYKKLMILDKSAIDISMLKRYIIASQCKNIVIDYLGYLQGKGKDTYTRVSDLARGLKELSKETDTRLIVLCQTSRGAEDGTKPVYLDHLRDSGVIEESADYVLGVWKSKEDYSRLHCNFLKARSASLGVNFDLVNKGLHLIEEDYSYHEEQKKDARF